LRILAEAGSSQGSNLEILSDASIVIEGTSNGSREDDSLKKHNNSQRNLQSKNHNSEEIIIVLLEGDDLLVAVFRAQLRPGWKEVQSLLMEDVLGNIHPVLNH
jgi:hypothetical protein